MSAINITIKNLDKLIGLAEKYPALAEKHINKAISRSLARIWGAEKKEARMRYLQQYWTSRVKDLPNIMINTPTENNRSCGIANVGIKGITPSALEKRLLKEHKIYTVAIDYANVQGCRITPNVFTSIEDLDVFVGALKKMATA